MNNLRKVAQAALEALKNALPIVQYDAQMMADLTRHAPLDPESQAKHDSTEYVSERLVRTIPPLIEKLEAALAEPLTEREIELLTEREIELLTEREIELLAGMIEVQLHHASQCDSIANRTMAAKQKGWDMERVALLRKLKGVKP